MVNSTGRRIVEGSCWACRKRRVKCSLDRPSCTRCQSAGTECEYGAKLHWVGGPAARGRHAPNSSPSPKPDQVVHLPLSPTPSTPDLDTESSVLYFYNAVIPRFQLEGRGIPLDEGLMLGDSALRSAVLAVSKSHYDLHSRSRSSHDGLRSREQSRQLALTSFRKRLESGIGCATTAQNLLQIVILFCMLDGVIHPSVEGNASAQHLKGGCSILDSWSSVPSTMILAGGFQAHLVSTFVTMDLVHALLAGEKPYFDPTSWLTFGEVDAWWGRLECGDRFLTLMKAFSEMALLGHVVKTNLPGDQGVKMAEKCIPSIQAALVASAGLHMAPNFASESDWDVFCSLYDIAATIYVHRALRNHPILDESVQAATRRGISKMLDDRLPGMLAHCVVFPLLVIGSHCIYTQDRKAAQDFLSRSTSYLSFGNLEVMSKLLRDIWSKEYLDSTWWEMFEPISSTTFLF